MDCYRWYLMIDIDRVIKGCVDRKMINDRLIDEGTDSSMNR